MKRARPDVMNHCSAGPRYAEMFVSKAMRSLFRSRTVGDAAVGWLAMMCHQLVIVLGEGVVGSAAAARTD